jgi:hypothetical protein
MPHQKQIIGQPLEPTMNNVQIGPNNLIWDKMELATSAQIVLTFLQRATYFEKYFSAECQKINQKSYFDRTKGKLW